MSEISILPQGAVIVPEILVEKDSIYATKTYKIKNGRIVGFCDEIDALKQAVELILSIERYEYLIYSWNYGNELNSVIGLDKNIAESELERLIKEALVQDDRITDVDNFIFSYCEDSLLIEFTIFSIYGYFKAERRIA